MKKILNIVILVGLLLSLSACNKADDIEHMGGNAEIIEMSNELKGFVVKGLDEDSILGEKCYINCEREELYFIYVDNGTSEVKDLYYRDFKVGDTITVDIKSVEDKYALAWRVQLLSQRK